MLYQTMNAHGGDLYGYPVELDFSVNTNPLGTPPAVVEAVRNAAQVLCQYPDPYCRELVKALAEYESVPEDCILCGCGAAELIYSYCRAIRARTALVTAPAFSEYASALQAEGCRVLSHPLREADQFEVTETFLETLGDTPAEAVFLCSPNNPTGRLIREDLLSAICRICQDRGIRLFVDECFLELSDRGRGASLVKNLETFPGLFLLKAFTKTYGMAGLRLGYCISRDQALLAKMGRTVQPWNVSLPAQRAGVAALGEQEFLRQSAELIQRERPWLTARLGELGFWVCPSQANYLLFKSVRELAAPLLERGILIRDCSNYEGLCRGWYRAAVKTHSENQQLIAVLAEICQPH